MDARLRASASRRRSHAGKIASFSGLVQLETSGPSPAAGTTSRSRARVAATYATRTPSAASRCTSSASWSSRSMGAHPARLIAHVPPRASTQRLAVDRDRSAPMSASTTIGNSRPFALCAVIKRTPSLPSSRIGASAARVESASSCSSSTNPRNDSPPDASYCRASSDDVLHIGQRLLAGGPEREDRMRTRRAEQPRNGLFDRTMIAAEAEVAEQIEGLDDWARCSGSVAGGRRNGCTRPARLAVLEQRFVADREQRSSQRPEHRQLIVRPLEGGERRAHRLDLLALVERLAADEQMRDAARFERLHVRPRDVLLPVAGSAVDPRVEAPEQQADVSGIDREPRPGPLAIGDRPAARPDQPFDERPDGVGQRLRNRRLGDLPAIAERTRHGERDHARL